MDDKFKNLSFSDFVTVDYAQLDDELAAYRRKRLKNGAMHESTEEELDEVLSNAQRVKAGQRMKRMSKRIQMAKKRALRKAPSMDILKKRAQKQARTDFIKKMSKGTAKSDMSMGQRAALEKRLAKKKSAIDRAAKKLIPQMRKIDKERRSAAQKGDDK